MHSFTELIDRCTTFTLSTLGEANEKTIEALETSADTSLVKTLQMIQLQKTILAVGMFSIFEANLQENLGCRNGCREAKRILDDESKLVLKEKFDNFYLAINVLKHGRGDKKRYQVNVIVSAVSLYTPFSMTLVVINKLLA